VKDAVVRELAATLDTTEMREVRAQRAAEIVRAARNYRWVGVYEVDDDRITILGHSGPTAPAFPSFEAFEGLSGEAVRTRAPVVSNDVSRDSRYRTTFESTGSETVVPILGAESGIVIGTLDVESERIGAFGRADEEFLEACAMALMPLFE
jgi:putative methionine-R-sulfoxide reductase with GAF domain